MSPFASSRNRVQPIAPRRERPLDHPRCRTNTRVTIARRVSDNCSCRSPSAAPISTNLSSLTCGATSCRSTSSWTVGEALDTLRTQQLGEKIIYFYAVDDDGRLEGIVPTRRLLMSAPDTPIASLDGDAVVTMPSWATVREASNLFLAHRFLAFPVVDTNRVLHGVADVSLFTRELADLANRQNADNAFQIDRYPPRRRRRPVGSASRIASRGCSPTSRAACSRPS